MNKNVKYLIARLLEKSEEDDKLGKAVDVSLMVLILLNVIVVLLETVPSVNGTMDKYFYSFEIFSVVIFSIEYVLRLWTCTVHGEFKGSVGGRIKYVITPMALIDLLAVLPFYLPLLFTHDLLMLRLFRLFRLLRLLKALRYSESLKVFTDVYRLKRSELTVVFMAILFLLVMASALLFHLENEAQPEAFSSIPAAMWWGVATLTTVGYGDITPITPLGKFFGAIIALLGIGLFALPAGIIGSGFVVALRRQESSKFHCPHCSQDITRSS
ncbi:MAG: voltage-gated potassium channel [Planctomycetota bacterium]|jgi:voltage-gated potassium channel